MRTVEERLKGKYTIAESGCWVWHGAFGGSRLPKPQIRINWKCYYVSRVVWELYKGKIPYKTLVCHTCDNNACINPDHMFLGSQKENMRDASRKGRFPGKKVMNEEIVENIHSLRQKGYTQKEISLATEIPIGTVGAILIGTRWGSCV